MPTMPASLVIAGQRHRVEVITDPNTGLGRYASPNAVGHQDTEAGVLRMRDGQSDDSLRDTLLHEVVHAVVELTYLGDELRKAELNERVVSCLATHLLDTFRRNPSLVAYLMDEAA